MTKAALCTHCFDIVSPYRNWREDRRWRWCECEHMAVRWQDGSTGQIEVTATHGPNYVRVIGLNNAFLEAAVGLVGATNEEWRELHAASANMVQPYYLFHEDKRSCWALIVRVGESSDVHFVDYAAAKWPAEVGGHG